MSVAITLDGPSVSVRAYVADPLSCEEIDAHPIGDRIWATIHALRSEAEERDDAAPLFEDYDEPTAVDVISEHRERIEKVVAELEGHSKESAVKLVDAIVEGLAS